MSVSSALFSCILSLFACAGYICACQISVVTASLCCTGFFDMPVMDEIVRDFKVVESSSESDSVSRQAGSGLPDKPLKTLNPVNSQCKSVCCTVLTQSGAQPLLSSSETG